MKKSTPLAAVLCFAMSLAPFAQAQSGSGAASAIAVSEAEANQHLMYQPRPTYPNIAKIAHVMGVVVLQAKVLEIGTVGDLTVVSGPPMLLQASIDAVKQWKYRPFLVHGEPAPATVNITIHFSLADDGGSTSSLLSRWQYKCETLIRQAQYADAAPACITAVNNAEQLSPDSNTYDRLQAYRDAATAFLMQKNFAAALPYATHELELSQAGSNQSELEMSQACYDLARILHGLGDDQQALTYYQHAVRILDNGRKRLDEDIYSESMHALLRDYAVFLRQTGLIDAAGQADLKAAALPPRQP